MERIALYRARTTGAVHFMIGVKQMRNKRLQINLNGLNRKPSSIKRAICVIKSLLVVDTCDTRSVTTSRNIVSGKLFNSSTSSSLELEAVGGFFLPSAFLSVFPSKCVKVVRSSRFCSCPLQNVATQVAQFT